MNNITYMQMYLDILKRYGKDSREMKTYLDAYSYYKDNKKVVYKIYEIIMKKG